LLANQAFHLQFDPALTKPNEIKKVKKVIQEAMEITFDRPTSKIPETSIIERIMDEAI